jgi:hypothetical protein
LSRRQRRIVAAFAAAALAVIVGLLVFATRLSRENEDLRARVRSIGSVSGLHAGDVKVVSRPPSAPESGLPTSIPAGTAHEGEIEVCGVGFVPRMDAEQPAFMAQLIVAGDALRQRLLKSLQTSSDAAVRAAAALLDASHAAADVTAAFAARQAQCGEDRVCRRDVAREAETGIDQASMPALDALAREAAGTRNPAAYAAAVQGCRAFDEHNRRNGNCQLISVEQWARIEPDNAVPWLHLSAIAAARNDAAGEAEALYRAGLATTHRTYGDALLSLVEPAFPADLSDIERLQATFEFSRLSAAWTLPDMMPALRACSADALRDSNRRQVCDALASNLVDKGGDLIELGIGTRMGERLGWPADRIAALRIERAAFSAVDVGAGPTLQTLSCASLKGIAAGLLRRSRYGEIASARRAIIESGKTIEDWADEGSRREEAVRLGAARRAAQSASQAASGSVNRP